MRCIHSVNKDLKKKWVNGSDVTLKKKAGHQAQNKRCSKSNRRARGKLKYPESKPIHAYDHKGKFSERGVQLSGSLESSQNQSVTFQNGQRTFREPT